MATFVNSVAESDDFQSYVNRFNKKDGIVRDMALYSVYLKPFTTYERLYILSLVIHLNMILYPYKFLYEIPWVFAKSMKGIENNYPHTQRDMIVLPYDFMNRKRKNLIKTIIHEKVHIYQTYNMIPTMSLYLDYWGLSVHSYTKNDDQRSNPDINNINFVYFDPTKNSNVHMYMKYKEHAKSLSDSFLIKETIDRPVQTLNTSSIYHSLIRNNSYQTEHPNELMACLIADIIIHKKKHEPTEKWMKTHLKSLNR